MAAGDEDRVCLSTNGPQPPGDIVTGLDDEDS